MTSRNQKAKIDLLAGTFDLPSDPDWQGMYRSLNGEFISLATELIETRRQRDALARRCAEQARHIAGLLDLQAEEAAEADRHPLADAIAVMQRAGVR